MGGRNAGVSLVGGVRGEDGMEHPWFWGDGSGASLVLERGGGGRIGASLVLRHWEVSRPSLYGSTGWGNRSILGFMDSRRGAVQSIPGSGIPRGSHRNIPDLGALEHPRKGLTEMSRRGMGQRASLALRLHQGTWR